MKTIIPGDRDRLKEYKYFSCGRCGWAGKADNKEYIYCGDQREGDKWKVECTCCGGTAYSVKGEKLEKLIKLDSQLNNKDYWENR